MSGNCKDELKRHCADVEAGESRLADCISAKIAEDEAATGEAAASPVSDACREEVYQYKIHR